MRTVDLPCGHGYGFASPGYLYLADYKGANGVAKGILRALDPVMFEIDHTRRKTSKQQGLNLLREKNMPMEGCAR